MIFMFEHVHDDAIGNTLPGNLLILNKEMFQNWVSLVNNYQQNQSQMILRKDENRKENKASDETWVITYTSALDFFHKKRIRKAYVTY